jgi:guanosine-3',5'-bis(diphosphate) 3'-pyrophosphohydrolase
MENIGQLLKAIRFAAEKHRNQRRKDNDHSPYINHPIQVAETLWEVGGVHDLSTLVAAVLHDTLEDTETSPDEIRQRFGQEVLDLVLEVSDDKHLPKVERKRLQIVHAPHISPRAKQLKLADKICNVRDLIDTPPADWPVRRQREYLRWAGKVVAGLRGANPALEELFDRELSRGKDKIRSK